QQSDRLEIFYDVVFETEDGAVQHMRPQEADTERIAVRSCASHTASANRSCGAGHILNDDRLSQGCTHLFRHNACDRIGWSPCGKWHNDGDRPRWIKLRRGTRERNRYDSKGKGSENCSARYHMCSLYNVSFARAAYSLEQ